MQVKKFEKKNKISNHWLKKNRTKNKVYPDFRQEGNADQNVTTILPKILTKKKQISKFF